MEEVFQGLHKLTGFPVDQMVATEVFKNHFQRIFDSTDNVDTFLDDRDRLYVYVTSFIPHICVPVHVFCPVFHLMYCTTFSGIKYQCQFMIRST